MSFGEFAGQAPSRSLKWPTFLRPYRIQVDASNRNDGNMVLPDATQTPDEPEETIVKSNPAITRIDRRGVVSAGSIPALEQGEVEPELERRLAFKNPISRLSLGFAACCVLLLTSCSSSPSPGSWAKTEESSIARIDPKISPDTQEAAILAERILRADRRELIFDAVRRQALSQEIGHVLGRMRNAYPEISDIRARQCAKPGTLLLGLEPALYEAVSSLSVHSSASGQFQTGHLEFNALNAQLGLQSIETYSLVNVVQVRLNELANLEAAKAAYLEISGVTYAEKNVQLGDGSDLAASRSNETWHIVVRKAWGDCPAGCLFEEISFIAVKGDNAKRIDLERAMENPEFAELLANLRPR